MAIDNPERKETIDDKKKRLEDPNLLEDQMRSFNDLASELTTKKDGEKYTGEDIKNATSKRITTMIESSGKKLSQDEIIELELIKTELLKGMGDKTANEAIKEYGEYRDKITGIIAAGDGKGKKDNDNFQKSQEQQKVQASTNNEAFDALREFIEKVLEAAHNKKKRAYKQERFAQMAGDSSQGCRSPQAEKAASQVLEGLKEAC